MLWKPCFEREPSSPMRKILPSASSRISDDRPALRVEGAGGDLVAGGDQLAQHRALAHDLGVAAQVGRARHALRQRVQVDEAAAFLGLAEALQLLEHGDHVGRLGRVDQRCRWRRRSAGARSGRSRCRSAGRRRGPRRCCRAAGRPARSARPRSNAAGCAGAPPRRRAAAPRRWLGRRRRHWRHGSLRSGNGLVGKRCGQPVTKRGKQLENPAANEKGPAMPALVDGRVENLNRFRRAPRP